MELKLTIVQPGSNNKAYDFESYDALNAFILPRLENKLEEKPVEEAPKEEEPKEDDKKEEAPKEEEK